MGLILDFGEDMSCSECPFNRSNKMEYHLERDEALKTLGLIALIFSNRDPKDAAAFCDRMGITDALKSAINNS